jgi:hypothetical protein
MKQLLPVLSVLGLLTASAPVFAHHAFAAEYDVGKPMTLKGKVTNFEWVNPHGWLHIDVTDSDGKVVNWAVEFGAPAALLKRGFRKTDLPAGLEVVVKGYRAKNGTATINGSSVLFPDGRNLFTGGSNPDEQAPK